MTTFKDLPVGAYFKAASAPGKLLQKLAFGSKIIAVADNYDQAVVKPDTPCTAIPPQDVPRRNDQTDMISRDEED